MISGIACVLLYQDGMAVRCDVSGCNFRLMLRGLHPFFNGSFVEIKEWEKIKLYCMQKKNKKSKNWIHKSFNIWYNVRIRF